MPASIYTLIAGANERYPGVPMNPPATPDYGTEETSAGQTTSRDQWLLNNMFHTEDESMNPNRDTIFLSLLPKYEVTGFVDNDLDNKPKMKFTTVFELFWTMYGMITKEDLLYNTKRMQADWQPHQGIKILFQHIEEGATFAIFTKKSMD